MGCGVPLGPSLFPAVPGPLSPAGGDGMQCLALPDRGGGKTEGIYPSPFSKCSDLNSIFCCSCKIHE